VQQQILRLIEWIARAFICFTLAKVEAAPTLLLTHLPAYGSFDNLQGVALNVSPTANRIAVFIYVPQYGWVSKPTCAQSLTSIDPDGNWTADITTGGSDQIATRIAAFVVSTNYNQPCVQGAAFLPTNIYSQAQASAVITRQSPAVRWLNFSGYDWGVKTSIGPVGPGPNFFSDSTNNVWLDAIGRLHLRVTNRSNQWQCAEIISARTFGYGSYRFQLDFVVNELNVNAVLGLFTWSDDPAFTHRELDIECSRWSNADDPNSAQFVVQPYNLAGHLLRYSVPALVSNSTHFFTWESNRVSFQSQRGAYSLNPNPTNVLSSWTYSLLTPQTGDENVRLNLWLFNGSAPSKGNEVEAIIRSFEFVPLSPPQPALLKNYGLQPNRAIRFTIQGQPDRRYLIQATSNLLEWQWLGTILSTNVTCDFDETNPFSSTTRYYRAITLP